MSRSYRLNAKVTGDFTIGSDARIVADGLGYVRSGGGGHPASDGTSGGCYGGHGGLYRGTFNHTYGSYAEPADDLGGGGCWENNSVLNGGGAIKLTVGGKLTHEGVVSANGSGTGGFYYGAGGGIGIAAAEIAGTGTLTANAPSATFASGGGGRIAVKLTKSGADFTDYDIRNLAKAVALGSGGAGTVYAETASDIPGEGWLILNGNDKTPSVESTNPDPFVPGVNRLHFAKISLINRAMLRVGSGNTLDLTDTEVEVIRGYNTQTMNGILVNGGNLVWSEDNESQIGYRLELKTPVSFCGAKLVCAEKGVILASDSFDLDGELSVKKGGSFQSSGVATFSGNLAIEAGATVTFSTLNLQTAGTTVSVEPGATLTVSTLANFVCEDGQVEIVASGEGQWNFANAGDTLMTGIRLGGCKPTKGFTVLNGADAGDNADVVKFQTIEPGEVISWTGAASSSWGDEDNWDRKRAPIKTDNVVIESGKNAARPDTDVSVESLTISQGATFDIGAHGLVVAGDLSSSGTIVAAEGGWLQVGGNLTLGGSAALTGSFLTLTGAEKQALTAAEGVVFGALVVETPALTVAGQVTCGSFTLERAGASVTFAAGATLKADEFTVTGTRDAPVVLAGAGAAVWNLDVSSASVSFAEVSGSDASRGVLILPSESADKGDNQNWMFVDTRIHWDGVAPIEPTDDVVIDNGADLALGSDCSMRSLTVAAGARLTVNADVAVSGAVTVEGDGELVWNRPGVIGGNLTVLAGGVLTHDKCGKTEANKLSLNVAGSGYVQKGGKISATGKGHGPAQEGLGSVVGNCSASYGGRGYNFTQTWEIAPCYGSILHPTDCGSANCSYCESVAGGAIRLSFGGALTLDGTIEANGSDSVSYYSATGGSVWLTAQALIGSGAITANGGHGKQASQGSGGRIALELTGKGASFASFAGNAKVQAHGGTNGSGNVNGSAGTVCRTMAGGRPVVTLCNGTSVERNTAWDATDFPVTVASVAGETKGVVLELGEKATLNLTQDCEISVIKPLDTTARILLNGYTLRIQTPMSAKERKALQAKLDQVTTPGTREVDGRQVTGSIEFARRGLIVNIK